MPNGLAAMGMAVPGESAAKLVQTGRRVVAVTSDAGFLMNSQEMEIAQRVGPSFVVLVFNDEGYGLIRWKQMMCFGRPAVVHFRNPDLVRSAGELGPPLREALGSGRLTVIDRPVDASDNLRLTERLRISGVRAARGRRPGGAAEPGVVRGHRDMG